MCQGADVEHVQRGYRSAGEVRFKVFIAKEFSTNLNVRKNKKGTPPRGSRATTQSNASAGIDWHM